MTDKVQKIREEVEKIARSINPFIPDEDGKNSDYEAGRFAMATQILQIIDSLEEPKDRCKGCNNVKGCVTCVDGSEWAHYHREESVSGDLLDTTQTITYNGEVYTRCYKDKLDAFACKYPMSVPKTSKKYAKYSDVDLTIAVKEGAKWQKEQDKETIELAEDHAMLAGMEKMKEQMMKGAVDGIVYSQRKDMAIVRSNVFFPTDLKKGDKVKLIIIKED